MSKDGPVTKEEIENFPNCPPYINDEEDIHEKLDAYLMKKFLPRIIDVRVYGSQDDQQS